MTWEKVAHTNCPKPLLAAAFTPSGSIWRCDTCGKRWRLEKFRDGSNEQRIRWVRL